MSPNYDSTLDRLTDIANDLKTMIAVHDQRLNQQEKDTTTLSTTVEKRREELDSKLKDVYETIREQDNNILKEICDLREESNRQHKVLSEKISSLEKYIYVAIGGGIVITWILTNLANYLKLLQH